MLRARRTGTSVWIEAARPKTLPAAVAPVLVGTAAADGFSPWRFLAALVVALALQVGANYANDYSDGVRGVDTGSRTGPRRAVASGLVPPRAMLVAALLAFGVACVAGVALAVAVGWWLIAVGAACVLAALGYSGGPRPYASSGLGVVFVFVFFGLVATAGSAFVQDERLPAVALAAAVPMGLLACGILVANNLRDLDADASAGKRTLAVRLGDAGTRRLFAVFVLLPFALLPVVSLFAGSAWPLLALAALPLSLPALRGVRGGLKGRDLVSALAGVARVELAYGVLLAAGLALAG